MVSEPQASGEAGWLAGSSLPHEGDDGGGQGRRLDFAKVGRPPPSFQAGVQEVPWRKAEWQEHQVGNSAGRGSPGRAACSAAASL